LNQNRSRAFVRREFAAVFVGGMVGTLLRAGLLEAFPVRAAEWPWPTFFANVAGCAILGYLITHLRVNGGSSVRLALLGTGLCGALTTFSTLQVEIYDLLDAGEAGLAVIYLGTSIVLGLVAVSLARRAVERGRELA
jgi:CrcB protein